MLFFIVFAFGLHRKIENEPVYDWQLSHLSVLPPETAPNFDHETAKWLFYKMGPNTKGKGARLLGPQTKGKVARHLLIVDTASILAYKEAGWSAKNIAERLGRDKDTINRVLATLKATLDKGIPRQKKGL
jgi:hypothetical protein